MRLMCSLAVCCVLLASVASASYESSDQDDLSKFEYLDSGSGLVGPPYMEEFQWMLFYEPGCLHFVFSHSLDISQSQELEVHQRVFRLSWDTCFFSLWGKNWTSISMSLHGNVQEAASFFLRHLRQLSFINNIENRQ